MKNKLMKILGIALTLAVLVGLLIPAMPASAGTLNWTTQDLPSKFVDGSNITAMGMSPDGKTILVYNGRYDDSSAVGDNNNGFAKSTDGGVTFTGKGVNKPDDDADFVRFDNVTQITFSPDYSTDTTIIIVAAAGGGSFEVYKSDDSGKTWSVMDAGDNASGDVISADIAYDYNGKLNIVIGYIDKIVLYSEKGTTNWYDLSVSSDSATYYPWIAGDVLAVKFSTDFANVAEILALVEVSNVTGSVDNPQEGPILETAIVPKKIENTSWNDTYKYTTF
jgi:hypothetical protein